MRAPSPLLLLAAAGATCALAAASSRPVLADVAVEEPPPPDDQTAQVDLGRYLGTWYEIARFPSYFERGCVGVTATYARRDDGRISVTNRCRKERLDGPEKSVTGKAWAPDPAVTGKLKVQFFWPFRGDYWVLEVAPDYSWAIVGGPKRDQAWILSRTPTIPEDLYEYLVGRLLRRGYPTARLERVPQAPAPAAK